MNESPNEQPEKNNQKIGLRVRVLNADRNEDLGNGTIVAYQEIDIFGTKCQTPKILLDSGETVFGSETWWAPSDGVDKKQRSNE